MTHIGNKKNQNIGVPLPKSRDKIYTVEQNRMLDQITLEICEAWGKDLVKIRQSFESNQKLSSLLYNMYIEVLGKTNDMDKFLDSAKVISLDKIREGQISLESQVSSMRNEIENLKRRLDVEHVKDCLESKKEILTAMKDMHSLILDFSLKNNEKEKKWWKFWR